MLESICLGHFFVAGGFVGLCFIVLIVIKPAPFPVVMLPIEEAKHDTQILDADGNRLVVQLKEVTRGNNKEAVTSHQESSCIQRN